MDFILLPLSFITERCAAANGAWQPPVLAWLGKSSDSPPLLLWRLSPEQRSWFCSQSLSTLSVIEEFLAKRPMPSPPGSDGGVHNWVRNINYYSECSQSSLLRWHCLILCDGLIPESHLPPCNCPCASKCSFEAFFWWSFFQISYFRCLRRQSQLGSK